MTEPTNAQPTAVDLLDDLDVIKSRIAHYRITDSKLQTRLLRLRAYLETAAEKETVTK